MNNNDKSYKWKKASDIVGALKAAQSHGNGRNNKDDSAEIVSGLGLAPTICKDFAISGDSKGPNDAGKQLNLDELYGKLFSKILQEKSDDSLVSLLQTAVENFREENLTFPKSSFSIKLESDLGKNDTVYAKIPDTEYVLYFQPCYTIFKMSLFALLVKHTLGEDAYNNLWLYCECI